MTLVVLMSGGMDSTLVAAMALEDGIEVLPLHVNYGQIAAQREWAACTAICRVLGLSPPVKADVSGYGRLIESGLTSAHLDVNRDAFLPGRNMLFLLVAAAYALRSGAEAVAIGLLDERARLFPDQSREFLAAAETAVAVAFGQDIRIAAPLIDWSKAAVLSALAARGIKGTYSCHAGGEVPCGLCISCLEIQGAESIPKR